MSKSYLSRAKELGSNGLHSAARLENFAPIFFWSKWSLIILTFVWVVLYLVSIIIKIRIKKLKNKGIDVTHKLEKYEKFTKKLEIFNNILFYLLAVFIFVICIVIAIVTAKESSYIINEFKNMTINKFAVKNPFSKKIDVQNPAFQAKVIQENPNVELPRYFVSLIFWMFIYFAVIVLTIVLGKALDKSSLVHNLL
jgi:hypothetical protein